MIQKTIIQGIKQSLETLNHKESNIEIKRPSNAVFGDFTTNIALKIAKIAKKNPMDLAQCIAHSLPHNDYIEKIEVVKPGFINFWIAKQYLLCELSAIIQAKEKYGSSNYFKNKKVMVEYTDPNPFKEFHIGHLYSNTVGESLARLYEVLGAQVKRANYEGDVGMHVAKSLYGMQRLMAEKSITLKDLAKQSLQERVNFMGKAYAFGAEKFEEDKTIKNEIVQLNKKIYDMDNEIKELYKLGRRWTLDYFETIYKRLGTRFDYYYFEREIGKKGLEYVKNHIKDGIFSHSEGAVIFDGKKYGLHARVFINSFGLPTYEAKDLGLVPTKYADFPYDTSIIVTGNEIKEYFKVVLKALEIINPELRKKTYHIGHGMLRLPKGKMSSRTGNIITAEWLLDEVKKKVTNIIAKNSKTQENEKDEVCEKITVGAIKYSLLKTNIGHDVKFSFKESLSFEGNSGPYLQYTYARCKSVLEKSGEKTQLTFQNINDLYPEEIALLRKYIAFPQVIIEAGKAFAPNLVCSYLFELAQLYNLFYQKHPILKAATKQKQFRLLLTQATAYIIKNGLYVLGIQTVEKM